MKCGNCDKSAQHSSFVAYMKYMPHPYFDIEGLHVVSRSTGDQIVVNLTHSYPSLYNYDCIEVHTNTRTNENFNKRQCLINQQYILCVFVMFVYFV